MLLMRAHAADRDSDRRLIIKKKIQHEIHEYLDRTAILGGGRLVLWRARGRSPVGSDGVGIHLACCSGVTLPFRAATV